MAIRSPKEIRPARIIAIVWVVLSLAGAVLVGIIGKLYLAKLGIILNETTSETVFMVMVTNTNIAPGIIAGILLSAILAAIMSTADSKSW